MLKLRIMGMATELLSHYSIQRIEEMKVLLFDMTANALPEDKENCLKAGMNDYISKPIYLEALQTMLNTTSQIFQIHYGIKTLLASRV